MATIPRTPLLSTSVTSDAILHAGQAVILQEASGLAELATQLDENFVKAVNAILTVENRIVVTGVGKSGHVGRKIAATLAATGTISFFVHASEAAHGDLGMVAPGDLLLVLSNSGRSRELRPLLNYAQRIGVGVVAIVSSPQSPLACAADIVLQLPDAPEACPVRVAPTTSTTMMLGLGDALALAVMQQRGLTRADIAQWHPGGDIGSRLSPIEDVVDLEEPMPLVRWDAPMRDVVFEMTSGGKGVTGVVDEAGALVGIITDGDLRRAFDQVLTARAADVMTRAPITAARGSSVEDVLALMNETKITVLFVTETDDPTRPVAVAHIHDLVA